jgi:uncharacterized Zn finger protein
MSWHREKYFRCNKCGDLQTTSDIQKAQKQSPLSMCLCSHNKGKTLIPYDEISRKEYNVRLQEV